MDEMNADIFVERLLEVQTSCGRIYDTVDKRQLKKEYRRFRLTAKEVEELIVRLKRVERFPTPGIVAREMEGVRRSKISGPQFYPCGRCNPSWAPARVPGWLWHMEQKCVKACGCDNSVDTYGESVVDLIERGVTRLKDWENSDHKPADVFNKADYVLYMAEGRVGLESAWEENKRRSSS